MNKIGIIVLFLALCAAGWYFFIEKGGSRDDSRVDVAALNETTTLVERDELHLAFRYPNEAYTMLSAPLGSALQNSSLVESFVVVETEAYDAAVANGATEYPPLFTITVFDNADDDTEEAASTEYVSRSERLQTWARQYPGLTNIDGQLTEPVTETDIDGVSGITYASDGLYNNKTYVLTYRDYIYLITLQSNGDADNDAAFAQVFDSIEFQ